jgi:hypothetical protein
LFATYRQHNPNFPQKKESTLKANRICHKQTIEQNGTIRKQNGTRYKHQQEQQEEQDDDDFQQSKFCEGK